MTNSSGSVYFIQRGKDGPIKIGFSVKAEDRIKKLQTGSDEKLTLLGHVFGGRYEEYAIQQRFAHLRISGEWFRADPSLLDFIKVTNGLTFPSMRDHRFHEWIKRFQNDDSPMGDLARDIVADKVFPISNDLTAIVAHLRDAGALGGIGPVSQCFYEAWIKWSEYVIFAVTDDEQEDQ